MLFIWRSYISKHQIRIHGLKQSLKMEGNIHRIVTIPKFPDIPDTEPVSKAAVEYLTAFG